MSASPAPLVEPVSPCVRCKSHWARLINSSSSHKRLLGRECQLRCNRMNCRLSREHMWVVKRLSTSPAYRDPDNHGHFHLALFYRPFGSNFQYQTFNHYRWLYGALLTETDICKLAARYSILSLSSCLGICYPIPEYYHDFFLSSSSAFLSNSRRCFHEILTG